MANTFKSKNIFITANYYGALTNKRECFFFIIPPWQVLNFTWIVRYLKSYYARIIKWETMNALDFNSPIVGN